MRVSTAICAFALAVTCAAPALAHNFCGDGRKNWNEECDPGGELRCNGDPSQPVCRNGSDCPSGVNCYFALSCCKFNCEYVGQGATCFDGDDCSGPDRCNNIGHCVGSPKSGNSCNDDNTCTGNDVCVNGDCRGSLPQECDDHNPCTDDFCNPTGNGGNGACGRTNNTTPCNDGKFCTTGDRCSAGQCAAGSPLSCNDGIVCTLDTCDEARDVCVNAGDPSKSGQPCNDSNMCTGSDVCNATGGCIGAPVSCNDDNNSCTADTCNVVSGCAYDVVIESPACGSCSDGADNDGDGDTDAEDCDCNLLCETFHYAVVANRDSTRRTAYFGKDTRAARGFDPDHGSSDSSAPYPLGPSTASACSQGKLELVERSAIDGTGTASTRAEFGDGEQTEAVIIQIDRTFTLGVRARVELQGGLQPDHVLWLVDRRGRAYIGNQEAEPASDDVATLPGTMLAPEKNIVVGKKARVAGALLGRQVQLNEKAVVSHRPYIAAVP